MIAPTARTAVLVEGESDREAVLALADKRGVGLAERGVDVVAMGGATNVARYVAELGPAGRGLRLTGLYDAGEERFVRGGLERGGLGPAPGREGLAALGFPCCERDLEDELIRALGVERMLAVVDGAAVSSTRSGCCSSSRPSAGGAPRTSCTGSSAPGRDARCATGGCWSRRSTRTRCRRR